jgi:hypothetical protein
MQTQQKIDWWKLNSLALIYGMLVFWYQSFPKFPQMIIPVIIISTIMALIGYALWKHSIFTFYLILGMSIISLIETSINIINGKYIISFATFNTIITFILIFGLANQVFLKKK